MRYLGRLCCRSLTKKQLYENKKVPSEKNYIGNSTVRQTSKQACEHLNSNGQWTRIRFCGLFCFNINSAKWLLFVHLRGQSWTCQNIPAQGWKPLIDYCVFVIKRAFFKCNANNKWTFQKKTNVTLWKINLYFVNRWKPTVIQFAPFILKYF